MSAQTILAELAASADPIRAAAGQRYFKTGPGQYGAGDIFIGVTVPVVRLIAKRHRSLVLDEIEPLLASPLHEARLTGLLIMTYAMARADESGRGALVYFYLAHTDRINNWDLVDSSASHILGEYYLTHPGREKLYALAVSSNLWERRIAIIATFAFIGAGEYGDTLAIAELLLGDREDLIHKAVGWALREVGKRDQAAEEEFLRAHASTMPRTMLRYALERLSPERRAYYLAARGTL